MGINGFVTPPVWRETAKKQGVILTVGFPDFQQLFARQRVTKMPLYSGYYASSDVAAARQLWTVAVTKQ